MNPNPAKPKPEHNERQDWVIVALILLIGLCGVTGAGQWALRFVPNWQLNADMGSHLDLNSEFLTSKPIAYFEPVDPAILTQPAWVNGNVFLTPGVDNSLVKHSTPLPTSNSSTGVPTVMGTTTVAATPGVGTNTVVPTSTLVWIPIPATKTSKPDGQAPTNTSPAPNPSANLGITQSDGTTSYVAGGTLTYTVTVTNAGPSNVNGATVTNAFTAQVTGASWSCVAAGTVCGAGGPGTINDVVNLPVGSSITYTINVNINAGASGDLVHSASVTMPGGYTETNPANNIFPDTNTPILSADLWITKDDGANVYAAGGTTTYTVTVGNYGPSNVTGATVTDTFPTQISGTAWTCGSTTGGSCTASGSGNINDSAVNLPAGSSVTYTIVAAIDGGAFGSLSNTASVDATSAGYTDPEPGNNFATDPNTDVLIITDSTPGEIGTSPGGGVYTVSTGSSLTLKNANIVIDGDPGVWDLIYYELTVSAGGIDMDRVIVEISDGHNWYTILNWGNGSADANTNVNIDVIGGSEDDNRHFNPGDLYNSTGIAIELDGFGIPNGTYSYIRITAPGGDSGNDGCDIDAIDPAP